MLTVTDSIFSANSATAGGAIDNFSGSVSDSYNVYSSNSGGDADGGRQRAVRRRST